jgi:hypothetical protein
MLSSERTSHMEAVPEIEVCQNSSTPPRRAAPPAYNAAASEGEPMTTPRRPARLVRVLAALSLAAAASAAGADKPPSYRCLGFDEPIRNDMQVGKGRVLPLRGKLAIAGGGFADAKTLKASPRVRVFYVPESGPEVDRTDQIDLRDYGKGTSFVWDPEAHWKFDLGTLKFEKTGRYKAQMLSGDEAEYHVDPLCEVTFQLRGEK